MKATTFFLILLLQFQVLAQPSTEQVRIWSFYSAVGFTEYLVLGGQYQASERLSFGGKFTVVGVGGSGSVVFPVSGKGVGAKLAYYFDPTGERNFLGFNAVNLEAAYLQHSSSSDTQILAVEETLSHDSIIGTGVKMVFAIGASHAYPTRGFALHSVALKLGIRYDI